MSIAYEEKRNLLSGSYTKIIISENENNNYRVASVPGRRGNVRKLDPAYSHLDTKKSDEEVIDEIINYYLFNNKIKMISYDGKLKYHEGKYLAVNAYENFIEGFIPIGTSLFLKIISRKDALTKKIEEYYREERIRHLDEITKRKNIKIHLFSYMTGYCIIDENTIEVFLKSHFKENELKTEIDDEELIFLESLIEELINKGFTNIRYGYNVNYLYDDTFKKCVEFDENIELSTILKIYNKIIKERRDFTYYGEEIFKVRKRNKDE